MTAKKTAGTTTAARKAGSTGKGKGSTGKGKPTAEMVPVTPDVAVEKVAAVAVPAPVPQTPAVPAPAPTPAAAPRVRHLWPANPAAPVPPAAGKLLQVLHAAGATEPGKGRTKGQCMADGCTNYGPSECRAAGLVDWTRGAGGSGTAGTRYLYLTPAGVAWVAANPTPIVLPPVQPRAAVLPPVQGPVTADGTPPAAVTPAVAG